mgnify:FL=1
MDFLDTLLYLASITIHWSSNDFTNLRIKSLKMIGLDRNICHYHKYGYCRAKNECERFHSSQTCSKTNCDIKSCSDRHPQQCRFYASQGFCKFGDSCFYDHKTTDQNKTLKSQFEDLKSKHDEILKVTSKQEEKIRFLEYKLDMLGRQMIGAVRELSEHIEHIENISKLK